MGYDFSDSTFTFVKKSITTFEYKVLLSMLIEMREKAGVRQVELAQKLHKPQSFVSKYENGERRLDVTELREICLGLNTTLQAFVAEFELVLALRKENLTNNQPIPPQ